MPIDLTLWPQPADVQQLLMAAGLWPTASGQQATATTEIAVALPATVAAFERRTGWLPFLAGDTSTRAFDGPDVRGLLDLNSGLIEITSLTVAGQPYIENTDYWLRASNAPFPLAPYDGIQFTSRALALNTMLAPNQIMITGRWGYGATLPSDVWDAVRGGAAALTAPRLASASTGVVRTVVENGFRQVFDLGLLRPARLQEWLAHYEATVAAYTRTVS